MLSKLSLGLLASTMTINEAQAQQEKRCNALALSGGGAKGAYESGALWGLWHNAQDKSEYAYSVSSGVSAGSINSAAISVFAPGDEEALCNFLDEKWQNLEKSDVYRNWCPFGPITGLTRESGIFNTVNLKEFITRVYKEFNNEIKKKIVVSCVDVNTGAYILFDENSPEIIDGVVASSSIPFVFPHQTFDTKPGVVCMDGGTVWNTNLVSSIEKCREQVDDDSQIYLDIAICDS